MKVNTKGLESVSKNIGKAKKILDEACEYIAGIKIPRKFVGNIREVSNDLYAIVIDIDGVKNWLDNQVSKFENLEEGEKSFIDMIFSDLLAGPFGLPTYFSKRNLMKAIEEKIYGKGTQNIENQDALIDIVLARLNGRDAFFSYFKDAKGLYGSHQGNYIRYYSSVQNDKEEYIRLLNILKTKYHMSTKEAIMVLKNYGGECTYGSIVDSIILHYSLRPNEFYEKYGFPLYVERRDGTININCGELFLYSYIKLNTGTNYDDKSVYYYDSDGKLRFNSNSKDGKPAVDYLVPALRGKRTANYRNWLW